VKCLSVWAVHRSTVHGVSGKKIRRMLSMYEHNVTAQSLFAMLQPLPLPIAYDSNQPPLLITATPSSSCNDNSKFAVHAGQLPVAVTPQPIETSPTGKASCNQPQSLTETATDSSSDYNQSVVCDQEMAATVPSGSCDDTSQSMIFESQLAATLISSSTSTSNAVIDSSPTQTSADVDNFCFLTSSSSSSSATAAAGEAVVMVTESVDRRNIDLTSAVNNNHRHFYPVSSSLSGPVEEAGITVTKAAAVDSENALDIVTNCLGSSSELVAEDTSCAVRTGEPVCYAEALAACDTQLEPDPEDSILVDSSDDITHPSTLDRSFATDAETGTTSSSELADMVPGRHCQQLSTETFCELQSGFRGNQMPNGEHVFSDVEHLKHLSADRTKCLIPADSTDVSSHKEKCLEVSFCCDRAESVAADQGQPNKTCDNIDGGIDIDRAAELLRDGISEPLPAATDAQLQHTVTAGLAESIVNRLTLSQCLDSDCSAVHEAEVENAESGCYAATPRATELLYWGQTGDNDDSIVGETETSQTEATDVVLSSSETLVAEMYASPWTEPKPRRMRPPKKPVSSLMESIMAGGKEWVSECSLPGWIDDQECMGEFTKPGLNVSKNSPSADLGHYCTVIDSSHHDEQSLVSSERCSSNFTQTEPSDFITLTKIISSNDEVVDASNYVSVLETTPRVISSSSLLSDQTSAKIAFQSVLHKSTSTMDETETLDGSSQLEFLASCFPTISLHDLQELLESCGNDTVVVADLLFEFGYEFNEPQDDVLDIRSSSTSGTDSAALSPSQSCVLESNSSSTTKSTARSRKNAPTLYRLYRDSVLPKGIVLQSRKMPTHCEKQVSVSSTPASGLHLRCLFYSAMYGWIAVPIHYSI